MIRTFSLTVNGKSVSLEAEESTPLLYILRNQLELNGPKFGCGLQQCGACMVLLGDQAVPSCGLPVSAAEGQTITTLEGLALADGTLHPVQQAFIDEQAAQCGYCLNGMVISTVALVRENDQPPEDLIRERLDRNICRCGVHARVIRAIKRLSES